jgi:hypothetical protein
VRIGVAEHADEHDDDGEGQEELLPGRTAADLAQRNDRNRGTENCTIHDGRENPSEPVRNARLLRKVSLHREGQNERTDGDAHRNDDRNEQCGDQGVELNPCGAEVEVCHVRMVLSGSGLVVARGRAAPVAVRLRISRAGTDTVAHAVALPWRCGRNPKACTQVHWPRVHCAYVG